MPTRTETKFYCDACDIELSKIPNIHTDQVHPDHKVSFRIMIDEALGPRLNRNYEMLCRECIEKLIKSVKDFQNDAKTRRL